MSTPEPTSTPALADLFASPGPSRPPPNPHAEALFLSPGSALDTPAPSRPARPSRAPTPPRQPVFDRASPVSPARGGRDTERADEYTFDTRRVDGIHRGLTQPGGDFGAGLVDPFPRDDDEDDEPGVKKRRTVAKVDPDRLMGDKGLTALMRSAKRFRVKGKGRETEDLAELMNVYQMWAHGMFPKGDFGHTIDRVEVVCRSRRMHSALKGYRDAFYPRPPSPEPVDLGVRVDPDEPSPRRSASPRQRASPSPRQRSSPGSEPLFAPRDADEEEDFGPDLDELAALEAAERGEEDEGAAARKENGSGEGKEVEVDDEAVQAAAEAEAELQRRRRDEEEAEEWAHMYD